MKSPNSSPATDAPAPTATDRFRRVPIAEWMAEGQRRFGTDMLKWRFKCPVCGHVQCAADFRPHKAAGATPEDARFNCIGRFTGANRKAFGAKSGTPGPCDYTTGGLFNLSPVQVVAEDGKICRSFEFADPTEH